MNQKYKMLFVYLMMSFILGGIFYLKLCEDNKKIEAQQSQYGGYLADGNYDYCKDLTSFSKQACLEEKTPGLSSQYPWLAQIAYFGGFPLFSILFWYFRENN